MLILSYKIWFSRSRQFFKDRYTDEDEDSNSLIDF